MERWSEEAPVLSPPLSPGVCFIASVGLWDGKGEKEESEEKKLDLEGKEKHIVSLSTPCYVDGSEERGGRKPFLCMRGSLSLSLSLSLSPSSGLSTGSFATRNETDLVPSSRDCAASDTVQREKGKKPLFHFFLWLSV